MNLHLFICLIFGIEAVANSYSKHPIFFCPKMFSKTFLKSCTVCQQALQIKSAPYRVKAACSILARHQCCPSIQWTKSEGTSFKKVSTGNLLFTKLHLIWQKYIVLEKILSVSLPRVNEGSSNKKNYHNTKILFFTKLVV